MDDLLAILKEMHPEVDYGSYDGLIDNKVFDSFDVVSLIAEIDDRMGVRIPADEIVPENFNSYAALNSLIGRLNDD